MATTVFNDSTATALLESIQSKEESDKMDPQINVNGMNGCIESKTVNVVKGFLFEESNILLVHHLR